MTYTADIPKTGESLGSTRSRINTNFQEIANVIAVNHVAFNALGEGKHKFLQMPEQSAAPTTGPNEGGLYTKEAQGVTNLFFRAESNGQEIQLTRAQSAGSPLIGAAISFVGSTGATQYSFNASAVRNSIGNFTITMINALPSVNYVVHVDLIQDSGSGASTLLMSKVISASRTTTSFNIETRQTSNGALNDPTTVMISCVGG